MCEFGRHTHFGVEGFVNRTAVGDLEETLESQPERQAPAVADPAAGGLQRMTAEIPQRPDRHCDVSVESGRKALQKELWHLAE